MRREIFFAIAGVVLFGAGCQKTATDVKGDVPTAIEPASVSLDTSSAATSVLVFPGILSESERLNRAARIQTSRGEILIELFGDTAPKAVSNFLFLSQSGFYDGLTFHRREEGFVIQGGDPDGDGTGGPGYTFEDEFGDDRRYDRGIAAMANRGPNTNGSQFFIMLEDYPLPKQYTIFGRVIQGMDVVDRVAVGDVIQTVLLESASSVSDE